jgi:hypothetical protein
VGSTMMTMLSAVTTAASAVAGLAAASFVGIGEGALAARAIGGEPPTPPPRSSPPAPAVEARWSPAPAVGGGAAGGAIASTSMSPTPLPYGRTNGASSGPSDAPSSATTPSPSSVRRGVPRATDTVESTFRLGDSVGSAHRGKE